MEDTEWNDILRQKVLRLMQGILPELDTDQLNDLIDEGSLV
jgi:hypothetical protein